MGAAWTPAANGLNKNIEMSVLEEISAAGTGILLFLRTDDLRGIPQKIMRKRAE